MAIPQYQMFAGGSANEKVDVWIKRVSAKYPMGGNFPGDSPLACALDEMVKMVKDGRANQTDFRLCLSTVVAMGALAPEVPASGFVEKDGA